MVEMIRGIALGQRVERQKPIEERLASDTILPQLLSRAKNAAVLGIGGFVLAEIVLTALDTPYETRTAAAGLVGLVPSAIIHTKWYLWTKKSFNRQG